LQTPPYSFLNSITFGVFARCTSMISLHNVLGLYIGEHETSKFRLTVLNAIFKIPQYSPKKHKTQLCSVHR